MIKFVKMLKSNDVFGHKVRLNFNNSGTSYGTITGGIATIVLYLFMGFYLISLIQKVNNPRYDNITNEL